MVASKQGGIAKKARIDLEKKTGHKIVTSDRFQPALEKISEVD